MEIKKEGIKGTRIEKQLQCIFREEGALYESVQQNEWSLLKFPLLHLPPFCPASDLIAHTHSWPHRKRCLTLSWAAKMPLHLKLDERISRWAINRVE